MAGLDDEYRSTLLESRIKMCYPCMENEPSRKFYRWPNGVKVLCTEKHHFDIGHKLTFYGVSWEESEASLILPLLKLYSRKAFRGDTKTTNVTELIKK